MAIKEGNIISGTDLYGKEIKGTVIGIMNTLKFATIKTGKDRLDTTIVSLDNIKIEE